jgi:glycosyltransferase involved in cell wall biosynthesis
VISRLKGLLRTAVVAAFAAATVVLYAAVLAPVSRIQRARRRRSGRPPRILWAPVPIVNIRYSALADRVSGYPSETLVYGVYRINARADFDHVLDRWSAMPVVRQFVPYVVFLWAGLRYDVFGFFFDGGLLAATPQWRTELALLKLAGKRIVVYPYGGDARLPSVVRARGGWHAYSDVPPGEEDRDEKAIRQRLDAFARYADAMLGCADVYEELPRCDGMLRYPFDQSGWEPANAPARNTVVVVHAPNHRHYKGTRHLEAAVATLQDEGLPVELELVEGLPNAEVRRIYRAADVVADQFLIGAYALLAIEAMALGKPVLCYLNPRFREAHPEWDECPIVPASPDTLVEELRRLVLDPGLRESLGRRGPPYVRRYHSLESVGRDMDAIYRSFD